jgi:hypothetical protein
MPNQKSPDRLPFEPRSQKKKTLKQPPLVRKPVSQEQKQAASLKAIPETVSKRMVRRMALFSGVPTGLGMSSFFIFYLIVSNEWLEIPTGLVFAVSLGLFGLGVLGLSYGIFSTSWDENQAGSWWGWQQFKVNFARTTQAWRSGGKEIQETKKQAEN